jgi:hypothetical protein
MSSSASLSPAEKHSAFVNQLKSEKIFLAPLVRFCPRLSSFWFFESTDTTKHWPSRQVGGSDVAYRRLCRSFGARVTYTEMCIAAVWKRTTWCKRGDL